METPFDIPTAWPSYGDYDVMVAGAGPAGFAAALAAARLGCRTVLVDQYGFPGGTATVAGVNYLMGFWTAGRRQTAGGIADELVRELDRMGYARLAIKPAHVPDREPIGDRPLHDNVITDSSAIRVAMNRLLGEAGVERLYYSRVLGVVREKTLVKQAAVDTVDGPGLVSARTFIDATGDAHFAYRAGAPTVTAPVEDGMTKTLIFTVGGVRGFRKDVIDARFEELKAQGLLPLPGQDRFMAFATLNPGEVHMNMTMVAGNAVDAEDLTAMDIELRDQVIPCVRYLRTNIPEFNECYLVHTGCAVGIRAGRSIVGQEVITCKDLREGTPVPEPVALSTRSYGGHGIGSFRVAWAYDDTRLRGIPFGSLLPQGLENVIVGGRSISVEPRAVSHVRLMGTGMATGQAAGTAAALALKMNTTVGNVPYGELRDLLLKQKAILE